MIKINTRGGSEEAELSHVKRHMNKHLCCTSIDLGDYYFYFWQVTFFFNTACRICYMPGPANHSRWLAATAEFYYLFVHTVLQKEKKELEKENVPRIPSKKMRGFR